jgi:biopolymer transport protein ExbD/biopolymer transport protein TolR
MVPLPAGFPPAAASRFIDDTGTFRQKHHRTDQTMSIAVRNEGSNVNSNINVTPMVDVMLVLLIIFMVITPMLQNKVQIDMAQVTNPENMPDADKDDAIVVAITRDGGVFLGQNKVALTELGGLVRDKLADKPGKTIYVRADARAQFLAVENAIDAVRTAGVDDVGLLTQKKEGPGGAGGE